MPYKSAKQERFFHTKTAAAKGIKPSTVKEFDQASKGLDLPEEAPAKPANTDPAPVELTPNSKSHFRR